MPTSPKDVVRFLDLLMRQYVGCDDELEMLRIARAAVCEMTTADKPSVVFLRKQRDAQCTPADPRQHLIRFPEEDACD